jgi:hypothetical protein
VDERGRPRQRRRGDVPQAGAAPDCVELSLDVNPHGPIEKIGRGMRFTKRAVRADLHRFKAYAEMNEG